MWMALALLALLFMASLMLTLFSFKPTTKNFIPWLQNLSQKYPPNSNSSSTPSKMDHKKPKISKISSESKAELKTVFATFDKNRDGFITMKELAESFRIIGVEMTEEEIADTFKKMDSNGDGLIDVAEFCSLFESVGLEGEREGKGERDTDGELREAFELFDGNGDGLITVEELGLVLSSLGMKEGKSLQGCKEMIKGVDRDGDGMVNFEEFKKMMTKSGGTSISPS